MTLLVGLVAIGLFVAVCWGLGHIVSEFTELVDVPYIAKGFYVIYELIWLGVFLFFVGSAAQALGDLILHAVGVK